MSVYLNITNIENEYIQVELPIAWKQGVNKNGLDIKQDALYNDIHKQISNTRHSLPIVTSSKSVKRAVVDVKQIIGYIRQFNNETGVVLCSIKKGDYNIPLEDLQMTFSSLVEINDNGVVNNIRIIAGILILKGMSCYDNIKEEYNND